MNKGFSPLFVPLTIFLTSLSIYPSPMENGAAPKKERGTSQNDTSLIPLEKGKHIRARELRPLIGTDDFEELVTQSGVFVDKSLLIKKIIESKEKAILITRPRRWGKSLNMSMLKYFFNREVDEKGTLLDPNPHKKLFQNLKIAHETTFVEDFDQGTSREVNILEDFQGQHPTILLSLKDVKKETYEGMRGAIERQIIRLFSEYKHVPPIAGWWEASNGDDTVFFDKIREKTIDSKNIGLEGSLKVLSEWLYKYYGKKVYLLIDEYDTPLHEAYGNNYLDEAVNLMRDLFGSALKSNNALEKGILTGILRVAKANLFSGLNNFVEDSVLQGRYSAHYGFTEEEVGVLAGTQASAENKAELKKFYNGYKIGGRDIYNPWSVVNYLASSQLVPYWVDTGGTDLIKQVMVRDDIQDELDALRKGETIQKSIQKDIHFLDFEQNASALWPLLLYAGYLTPEEPPHFNSSLDAYESRLRIPNTEVKSLYNGLFSRWLRTKGLPGIKGFEKIQKVFEAIIHKDYRELEETLASGDKIEFSEKWNFNFLHIATLSGDEEIFKLVLSHYKPLLPVAGSDGLGVVDFALLGAAHLSQLGEYQTILKQPTYSQKGTCYYLLRDWIIGGGVGLATTTGIKMLHDQAYPPVENDPHWIMKMGVMGLIGGVVGYLANAKANTTLAEYCAHYDVFHAIDISKPASFTSLKQLEKYVLENPDSYVSLNGFCKENHGEITTLTMPAIDINYTPLKEFSFTLCKKRQD